MIPLPSRKNFTQLRHCERGASVSPARNTIGSLRDDGTKIGCPTRVRIQNPKREVPRTKRKGTFYPPSLTLSLSLSEC